MLLNLNVQLLIKKGTTRNNFDKWTMCKCDMKNIQNTLPLSDTLYSGVFSSPSSSLWFLLRPSSASSVSFWYPWGVELDNIGMNVLSLLSISAANVEWMS